MRLGLKMLGKILQILMVDTDFHHEIAVFFGGRNGLPMSFATILQDVQCEPASPRTQLQSIPFTVKIRLVFGEWEYDRNVMVILDEFDCNLSKCFKNEH
jgi:hypothetical protein